ncbi:MAG TPA: tetratricopeptide repeat protein, partial [Chloroflexota bacterium]
MSDIPNLIADARRAAFEHRFHDAARYASEALDRLPTCLAALRVLAWSQLELDDDAALATFEACTAYDPEDALAHVGQAIWYQQRGDNEAAIREWVRAWELDPHNQSIRRGLVKLTRELPESVRADAISLLRDGHDDEAVEALKRLRAQHADPEVALSLLSALWSSGAQREAFDLAMHIHASHPRSVKAALFVAAFEDRAGRTLRSREAIARAEQIDPGLTLFTDVVRQ